MSKDTLYRLGQYAFGVRGDDPTTTVSVKTELSAKAQAESDHTLKEEFQNLARAFLRLAEQAERNSHADIVYELPPKGDSDQA